MSAFNRVLVGVSLDETAATTLLTRACQIVEPNAIEAVYACNRLHHTPIDYPDGVFRSSDELDDAARHEALAFLGELCEPLGIGRRRVIDGNVVSALHDYARGHADLLVVGAHGRSGLAGMLETSNSLLHGTECDVLAVHLDRTDGVEPPVYARVLAAIDLSECSFEVLDHAHAVAMACDAQMMVCHVTRETSPRARNREWSQLEHFAQAYGLDEDDVFELDGYTARTIHQLARDVDADLVVVGTHGKHGWALLKGSTANAVLHGATCDELSVRIKSV